MMFVPVPFLLSLLGWTTLVCAYPASPSGPVVHLGYAKYQGASLENGISQWLGIRYAAPPVEDLRFRAPQDPILNAELQIADKVKSSITKR
jgi:acetylcholinesterase